MRTQLAAPSEARLTHPVLAFILSMLGIVIAGVVPALFGAGAPVAGNLSSVLIPLFSFVAAWIFLWLWVRFFEKRPFSSIGLQRPGVVRQTGYGLWVAIVLMALTLGSLMIAGMLRFTFGTVAVGPAVALLVAFIIQGGAEEVLFRGFLMQALLRRTSVIVAVIVQAVAFTLPHLMNPHITALGVANIVAGGLFFGMLAARTGKLWAPIAAHALWNWAQAAIVGFNVSGVSTKGWSLLEPKFADNVPLLLSGGDNGMEGMITAAIALILVTVWLAFRMPRGKVTSPLS